LPSRQNVAAKSPLSEPLRTILSDIGQFSEASINALPIENLSLTEGQAKLCRKGLTIVHF